MPRRSLVLAVLVASALTAACAGSTATGGTPVPPSATASSTAPPPLLLNPVGLVERDGEVWAAWAGSGSVSTLDAAGVAGPVTEVGDAPLRLAVVAGSVWVSVFGDGTVVSVAEPGGPVQASVEVGEEPEGLTTLDGRLWVVLQKSGELVEVDPAAGRVVRRYDVGGSPREVATDGRALFVTDHGSGVVVRVVPASSKRPLRSGPVCPGAQSVLVVDGRVMVACGDDDSVVALDPETLELTSRRVVPGGPDGLAVDPDGNVLVSLQDGPGLVALPVSGEPVTVATWSSGDLGDRANVGVLVVGRTAYVSDPLADVVHVVGL